jgi:hypothetical protein
MKVNFSRSKIAAAAAQVAHRLHDMLFEHMARMGLVLGAMKLKVDDKGTAVLADGKPVYILDDGREVAHDAEATVATISRLNGEAKAHREAKEAAETKLKGFDGIDDAEAARKALDTVRNLSTGELKTAAQVQEIKDAAAKSAQEAVAAATRTAAEREKTLGETNAKLTGQLNGLIVGTAFSGSKFVAEKLAIPADIAQKFFGDRFKVDNGKLVPLDRSGNPLFSAVRHGEHADVDEALQVMVSEYPNKDMILKGSGAQGSGAGGNQGAGGKKTYARAQFEKLDPVAQSAAAKEVREGKAVLTD